MAHLIYLLVLIVVGQQCEAKFGFGSSKITSEIVDTSKSIDVSSIYTQLCNPKHQSSHVAKQFSRISTILWLNQELVGHLRNAPSLNTDKNKCLVDYMAPLRELAPMIEARQLDACSDDHISLVEAFHRKYIERRWQSGKVKPGPLPDPLKWFFTHYASELSEVCQRNFVANLELMAKSSQAAQYGTMFEGMSAKIIQAFQRLLRSPEHISRQEDFVLIWSMIDRLSRKNLHKAGTDVIRMRLKTRDPSSIRAAQQNCRVNLRPFYHETALSSMRLIDMGYYSSAGSRRVDMSADGHYQNWYAIAQSCDFLLALEAYEDSSLKAQELVVISRDEAALLARDSSLQREPVKFNKTPASGWLAGDAVLQTVRADEDPNKLVKLIKSNVKSRVKSFKQLLHKIVKNELKGNLKGLFMSRKSKDGKKFVKTPEPWAEQVLEATNDEGAVFATSGELPSSASLQNSQEPLMARSWSDLDDETKDKLNNELRLHLQKDSSSNLDQPSSAQVNHLIDDAVNDVIDKEESLLYRSWSELDEATKERMYEALRQHLETKLESAPWKDQIILDRSLSSLTREELELLADDLQEIENEYELDNMSNAVLYDYDDDDDDEPKTWKQWVKKSSKKHPFIWGFGVPAVIVMIIFIIMAMIG